MTVSPSAAISSTVFFRRRADLCLDGWTDRALAVAVTSGIIARPRAGVYLPGDVDRDVLDACRFGGRLACVSELRRRRIFVLESDSLHVHVEPNASRLRVAPRSVRRHWARLRRTTHPRSTSVELFDALVQAVRCQQARAAVATLDSALYSGALDPDDLDELFRALPRRYAAVRALLDPRAESGPESLVRLMLRTLGVAFDVQQEIDGVGRVDFLVDGWLIVECDSQAHHSTWEAQRRDRRRDQAAAARGFATFRPLAEDIMWQPDEVRAALGGLLGTRRRSENSSSRSKTQAKVA